MGPVGDRVSNEHLLQMFPLVKSMQQAALEEHHRGTGWRAPRPYRAPLVRSVALPVFGKCSNQRGQADALPGEGDDNERCRGHFT